MHIVMLSLITALVVCALLLVLFGLFTLRLAARSGGRPSESGWRHDPRLG